jgi:hypothetical protein
MSKRKGRDLKKKIKPRISKSIVHPDIQICICRAITYVVSSSFFGGCTLTMCNWQSPFPFFREISGKI